MSMDDDDVQCGAVRDRYEATWRCGACDLVWDSCEPTPAACRARRAAAQSANDLKTSGMKIQTIADTAKHRDEKGPRRPFPAVDRA
jgi:hypothetical protein